MRCAIDHNGRRFTVLVTELLPGPRGTVATCGELPDLLGIGEDPDDALRRAVKTIERAVVPAGLSRHVTGRVPPKSRQPDAAPLPDQQQTVPWSPLAIRLERRPQTRSRNVEKFDRPVGFWAIGNTPLLRTGT